MRPLYSVLGALLLLLATPLASAATITVTTLSDELNSDGDCSLREAVAAANTNAAVDACTSGTTGEDNIVFSVTIAASSTVTLGQAAMDVTENLKLDGALIRGGITLDGADTYRIFRVTGGRLFVENTTFQNARAERGAAIYVASGATFEADDVIFADNVATGAEATDGGAAIYNDGGTIDLKRARLRGNAASGASGSGGAVFNNAGLLMVLDATFSGNTSMRAGGAIEAAGASQTRIVNTDFTDNEAGPNPGNGGAFHISGSGSATVQAGTVSGNVAAREGGGFWNNSGSMEVKRTTFTGNEARGNATDDGGGALFNNGGTMTVLNSTVTDNVASGASGSGGGLMTVGGTMIVRSTMIRANRANRAGAGIESAGATTSIEISTIEANIIPAASAAPGNGGGVHAGGGMLTIRGGQILSNEATEGGGVWANGGLLMESHVTGPRTVLNSNIGRGPAADNGGGGLYVETGGNATLNNVWMGENVASGASGSGGAVLVASGASATINGGQLDDNRANRAGAGIENAGGTMVLNNIRVNNNIIPAASAAPGNGGGLHSGGGAITIRGGVFTNNAATEGGALWSSGTLIIEPTSDGTPAMISANTGRGPNADHGGGGVFMETGGNATITGAMILNNTAPGASGSGGGLFVASGASATVTGGMISENTANRAGAGIENAGGTVTLVNASVRENVIPAASAAPGNGGGLHSGGGTVTVRGGDFTGNEATEGGALWSNGTMIIGDPDADYGDDSASVLITENIGRGPAAVNGGGGVFAKKGGDIRIYNANITDNAASGASGSGGGVFVDDESIVVIRGGTIAGNTANRAGAGIEVADDGDSARKTALVLSYVTIRDNSIATAAPGNGGGIHIGGSGVATIRNSTISGNMAREGAGVWVAGPGTLDIALSTVSGNAATEDGGGLYDNGGASSASISLQDVTVVMNTAGSNGGGLLSESADGESYTFMNSIIGANTAASGADCFGVFVSGGYNLVESMTGCTINGDTATNVTGSPMLAPLADNGGATMTHLPMSGSPVLNAGQSAFTLDQRGFLRNVGQNDIGSVELGAIAVPGEEGPVAIDTDFSLMPTRPNPARGQTTIAFTVAKASEVRIELYNVLGQLVQTVYDGTAQAGAEQTATVDASRIAPGTYIVRLAADGQQATRRMTIVR